MEWVRNDGIISSKDNRFVIIKATDKIHNGDWEIHDDQTKQIHYGYTLKHAKQISEDLLKIEEMLHNVKKIKHSG